MTSPSKTKRTAVYVPAKGERLCYEVNGVGCPLVMVCGAFGSVE
jgi:hypothetical protein